MRSIEMTVFLRMTLRRISVLALLVPVLAMAQSNHPKGDRNASLVNTFEVMCNLTAPNFAHLDAQATAMRMLVLADATMPTKEGAPIKRKAWLGSLTTGTFVLLAGEATGPKGVVTTCGILGEVDDAEAFHAAFLKQIDTAPTSQNRDAKGASVSLWRDYGGPGSSMVLREITQGGKKSVAVSLISLKPAQ